jgi:hypothetical protein
VRVRRRRPKSTAASGSSRGEPVTDATVPGSKRASTDRTDQLSDGNYSRFSDSTSRLSQSAGQVKTMKRGHQKLSQNRRAAQ